jgi:hypothetical protein
MVKNKYKILTIFFLGWLLQFLLVTIGPISYSIFNITIVFLILSFAMVFFGAGVAVHSPVINVKNQEKEIQSFKFNLFGVFSLMLALYAAEFYTGLNPQAVYLNIILGISNYNEYQRYFDEKELFSLDANKIPAIISFFLVKLYYYYAIYGLILKNNRSYRIGLTFALISLIHIAMARGTFFEFFEIILSICFFKLFSNIVAKKNNIIFIFYLLLIGILASIAHQQTVSLRFGSDELSYECIHAMCYNENSFLSTYFSGFAKLIYSLNGYFSFGYIYLSHFVEIVYENYFSLIFVPSEFLSSNLRPRFLCDLYIECSASWAPSFEGVILNLSLFGALIFMFLFGVILSILLRIIDIHSSFESIILLYFLFLFFFALPIGHFFRRVVPTFWCLYL